MKLINIEPILEQMKEGDLSKKELRRMIRNAPEIEAVSCSECILNEGGECMLMDAFPVSTDGFCSYGNRNPIPDE